MARARYAVALLASTALAGCAGTGDKVDAHALALEACSVIDQSFRQEFDVDVLQYIAGRYEASADKAAQAAAADPQYTDLVRSLTALEGFFDELASTVIEHGEDPAVWPAPAANRLLELGEDADAQADELEALCRVEQAR